MRKNYSEGISNKLAYIIIVLLSAIIAMGIYFIRENNANKNNTPLVTKQDTQKQTATTTKKEVPAVQEENDLYKGITDAGFVTFARTTIDKRCPFYEPNGVAYHECLSDWVADLEKSLLVEQVDEVHAYCEMFSGKYADKISFQSSELFTKCSIYKLQP